MAIAFRVFGELTTGEKVHAWTLTNFSGAHVEILTYGGIVRVLRIPDRSGRFDDVVLGFDRLDAYLGAHPYFGAIIGRIAGRVTKGRLMVDGRRWTLPCNEGENHLHGGHRGFDRRLWAAEPIAREDGSPSVSLSYRSADGEEGYPGGLDVRATYTLTSDNQLIFETDAESDVATPASLTQHIYFNLRGEGSGSVLGHEIQIFASEYIETDDNFTLSDRRRSVFGTGADLTAPRVLGDALDHIFKRHGDTYLLHPQGVQNPTIPVRAARIFEPESGRNLEVLTDDSCLQFYSGVGLDGTHVGKCGRVYGRHAGLCLECQGYANASGLQGFADIVVRPGTPQRRRTVYRFSTA